MNVFEAVKQSVTTRQAASYYGIRVGRNGMACCPFHNDRTPSMKVDSRYYCFGCGASGDVIDFAASLHGLGKRDAAVRLAEDFSIPYDGAIRTPAAKRTPPKPTPEQRLRQAEQHCFKVLCDYLHLLERWKIEYAPQPQDAAWHPLFVEALQKNSYVEYLLDILLFGEMEEKAALIAEQGKEVVRLEQRISELAHYGVALVPFHSENCHSKSLLLLWICYAVEARFRGIRYKSLAAPDTRPQNRL